MIPCSFEIVNKAIAAGLLLEYAPDKLKIVSTDNLPKEYSS